ncbi:MAG: hypothetical protein KJ749_02720, partial [Planctomycetes bacterium]|nr:hypothetical protein [Planctomycetota bacterium]
EAMQRVDPPGAKVRVITCADAEAAADTIASVVSCGDTVWVKGSRAMRLDLVAARLKDTRQPRVAVA